ncbi:DUF6787 domain-containing protein [Balamuthia mandrillaris]
MCSRLAQPGALPSCVSKTSLSHLFRRSVGHISSTRGGGGTTCSFAVLPLRGGCTVGGTPSPSLGLLRRPFHQTHSLVFSPNKNTFLSVRNNSNNKETSRLLLSGRRPFCSVNKKSAPQQQASSSSSSASTSITMQRWWQRWTAEVPPKPRWSFAWWLEMTLICTVFAITGSSSVFFVRPMMEHIFNLKGSMKEGPWSYRLISLVVIMPIYSMLLVCVGTLFGRHHYFKKFAARMWSRFLPKKLLEKISSSSSSRFHH